jgi:hypothetical protein
MPGARREGLFHVSTIPDPEAAVARARGEATVLSSPPMLRGPSLALATALTNFDLSD